MRISKLVVFLGLSLFLAVGKFSIASDTDESNTEQVEKSEIKSTEEVTKPSNVESEKKKVEESIAEDTDEASSESSDAETEDEDEEPDCD